MIYLVPTGGKLSSNFGILTAPYHRGVPDGISSGLPWAADMGCISGPEFVKRYDKTRSAEWLETMRTYKDTCLFIATPDHVGNARATLNEFTCWYFGDWPTAYIAQDGQEDLDFPPVDTWQALFIGGSTKWKMSPGAVECIRRAQELDKHIHIGRVNYWRRYKHFASLPGSERFTCDGTRIRYERDNALKQWALYMEKPKQYSLFVPPGDCRRQLDGD